MRAPSSFYCCFGCIHARSASLALLTGHVVVNIAATVILAYLIVLYTSQQHDTIKAMGPTQTDQALVQEVVRVEMEGDENDTEPVLLNKAVVNINVTRFINVFLIQPATRLPITLAQLIFGVLFVSLNGLVALMAILGIFKFSPGFMIPFFVGHILDIILSIAYIAGLDLYGYDSPALKTLTGTSAAKRSSEPWYRDAVAWGIVVALVIVFVKIYFVRVLWLTILYLKDERSRTAREERQQKWSQNLLEQTMMFENDYVDASGMPPTYREVAIRETEEENPPAYTATTV